MKKAVLITGGTAGTGYATAEKFAKSGYAVMITSRSQERAQEAADKIAKKYGVVAKGFGLDIRDEARIKEIFAQIDSMDCFVETVILNSANMGFGTDPAVGMDFFTVSVEEFQEVFETNLVWNFTIVRQAALRMREHHKGSIVFISSNTAYKAINNRIAYSASKGGINAMTRALALDLGPFGIRCNVVLPGTIKTERWVQMGNKQIVNGQLTPIGDISDFEDIANACWFFGTDMSKNVTGTELTVDGGMTSQLFPPILKEFKTKAMAYEEKYGPLE